MMIKRTDEIVDNNGNTDYHNNVRIAIITITMVISIIKYQQLYSSNCNNAIGDNNE